MLTKLNFKKILPLSLSVTLLLCERHSHMFNCLLLIFSRIKCILIFKCYRKQKGKRLCTHNGNCFITIMCTNL